MKSNKTPQTLKNDLLTSHVSHGIDQTNAVESEFNKMTFSILKIKIVTSESISVFNFSLTWIKDKWVCCIYMVINDITWKNTSLSLRKVEAWKFFFSTFLVSLRIIDVKDTSGKSGSHFPSVISVHS